MLKISFSSRACSKRSKFVIPNGSLAALLWKLITLARGNLVENYCDLVCNSIFY